MKYNSHKIKTAFGVFDSKLEYETFLYLKHQEDIGVISELRKQVRFEIVPKLTRKIEVQLKTKTKTIERTEEKAVHYTADFAYWKDGKYIIHEVKSAGTALAKDYAIRRKLIKHLIAKHNEETGEEEWIFKETGIKQKDTWNREKKNL